MKEGNDMKKAALLVLSAVFLFSLLVSPAAAAAVTFDDIAGHWAEETIEEWSSSGIVVGYDGKFRPDDNITRGEMAVILDRLMKYKVSVSNPFTDLASGKFYTDAVLKANAAGVMLGYNGKVNPTASITREDAFLMIARALKIGEVPGYTIKAPDAGNISDYAKKAIAAMESYGMIKGRPDGKMYPKDAITRAEVLQVLENIVARIYSAAGTYSENADGYVIVNTPDVVLKDMTINGTLVVAPGVGEGDCTIQNVKVTNGVVLLGGGANSFKVLGNSVITGTIIISKVEDGTAGGQVRVYTDEGVEIPVVYVDDGSEDVILEGTFTEVVVRGEVNVITPEGTTVEKLTLEAPAVISGTGTIVQAIVTAEASGATFETPPQTTTAPAGTVVVIGGEEIVSDGTAITEEETGTGGGGFTPTPTTVTSVTLYFSNGNEVNAALSGSTATFNLTATPDDWAIDGIKVTTSTTTTFVVGIDSIPTNSEVSMSTILALRGLSSPSVALSRIRALVDSVSITGTVTGGNSLTVVFNVGTNNAYFDVTNDGSTVKVKVKAAHLATAIPPTFSTVDPVDLLVANLGSTTAPSYTLTATKGAVTASRNYDFPALDALTFSGLVADFNATYVVDTLGDLVGITYTLTDGTNTVTLIVE